MSRARELEPRAERSAAPGQTQVWKAADRSWRYRYVHSARGTTIESNRGFVSKEEAVDAARVAYPGVPVAELAGPPGGGGPNRRPFAVRFAARLGLVGLLAWAAVVVLRITRRARGLVRILRR